MKPWILACSSLLITLSAAVADDVTAKAQICVACHGQKGVSQISQWPSLAGQKAGYLVVQIRAFRDGARKSPEMAPFVDNLSDQDIAELASFYSAQTPGVAANGDASLVDRGENLSAYCTACHGMNGTPVAETWPIIAGQGAAYLFRQLAAFKGGARVHPHMQAAVNRFGDDQFVALAAYYSQLEP